VVTQVDDVEPCPRGKLERQVERFFGHLLCAAEPERVKG
jgi:hypothetical protein